MTPEVVAKIEACSVLDPLHNPANLRGYHAAFAALPKVPHVAVFDTAFHQTMPGHAYLYGIPFQLYTKHHLRLRLHGTPPLRVRPRLCLGWSRDERRVTGPPRNGCSVAAIDRGEHRH
jgi:acetate kinase